MRTMETKLKIRKRRDTTQYSDERLDTNAVNRWHFFIKFIKIKEDVNIQVNNVKYNWGVLKKNKSNKQHIKKHDKLERTRRQRNPLKSESCQVHRTNKSANIGAMGRIYKLTRHYLLSFLLKSLLCSIFLSHLIRFLFSCISLSSSQLSALHCCQI